MLAQANKHEAIVEKIVNEFRMESKEARQAEAERSKVSAELARSGHAGINSLVTVVNELRTEIRNIHKDK
jgi:hypothetical protein